MACHMSKAVNVISLFLEVKWRFINVVMLHVTPGSPSVPSSTDEIAEIGAEAGLNVAPPLSTSKQR